MSVCVGAVSNLRPTRLGPRCRNQHWKPGSLGTLIPDPDARHPAPRILESFSMLSGTIRILTAQTSICFLHHPLNPKRQTPNQLAGVLTAVYATRAVSLRDCQTSSLAWLYVGFSKVLGFRGLGHLGVLGLGVRESRA